MLRSRPPRHDCAQELRVEDPMSDDDDVFVLSSPAVAFLEGGFDEL
jgi:hypothetical protein